MSSTNRGGKRSEADFYATPPWVVRRFLEAYPLSGGRWLEPCAGDGEIIRTVNASRTDVKWSACELREEMKPHLQPLVQERLVLNDLLACDLQDFGDNKFDVALTNPPFRIALPIVQKCRSLAKTTVMLLRLNFWGSEERQAFMEAYPPDTLVLPNRPMFSINKKGKPGTDSPEYAWMVWGDDAYYETAPSKAQIRVLKRTPLAERKEWGEHLKAMHEAALRNPKLVPRGTEDV